MQGRVAMFPGAHADNPVLNCAHYVFIILVPSEFIGDESCEVLTSQDRNPTHLLAGGLAHQGGNGFAISRSGGSNDGF